ncbi:MAG: AI-2E family transporter [Gammaproteobacteria bacterium]|nr:MAG: AI-2E family transporter [Gammaproteobacteria bacterium]
MSTQQTPLIRQIIFILAALVVVIAGMREAAELVNPFLLSLFIAIITAPPYFYLCRRGWPNWLALLAVLTSVILATVGIASLLAGSLANFSRDLPQYTAQLKGQTLGLLDWLSVHGIQVPTNELGSIIEPGTALRLVSNLMNGLGSTLGNGFLIFITVLFLLFEARGFQLKLKCLASSRGHDLATLYQIGDKINRYLAIKTITSLATGLLIGFFLWLLDVPYPVLWGTLAFLLNYIPTIGSILAGIPTVLLSLVIGGPGLALWVVGVYLIVNNLIGSILEPRFMGSRLGLSPLIVLLSMIFWGWVLGPVGMFLSVPITMTLKIALEGMPETRAIAMLMGPAPTAQEMADWKQGCKVE